MNKKLFQIIISGIILISLPLIANAVSSDEILKIGVASMITPLDSVKYYQDIVDYVAEKLGEDVKMIHRRTYDEMDRMLAKGEVDAAFICSAPYIKDKREFGVELLAAPVVENIPFYYSYIIIHKDSPFHFFEDLEGKSFAFTDPKSNSGKLYPEYYLARKGMTPEAFFKRYIYSYSHNKSVELVAKKIVDGAAVESPVYDYMKNKGSPYVVQTKIIHKSPKFGMPPVVVRAGLPTYKKEKMREILTGMHKDPDGRKILDSMLIDRFADVPESNYDSIREMESFCSKFRGTLADKGKPANTVYFGVIPRDNPRIAYEKYQPLIDFLSDNSPYKYELVLRKTYEDTINSLGAGEIDVALLGPLTYLEAHADYGAVCILKGITEKGKPLNRSVVITRKDSGIKKISDLKGKTFAFASTKSTSGNLIPRYLLADAGIHLRELGEYRNFDYHDSVVKWILRGKYDAGAVRTVVADKYLQLGLKIIAISEPFPTAPVVVGPKTPYVIVENVKSELSNISKTDGGKAVLKKLDPGFRGGFVEARDADYEGIRKLINDVPNTCGLGCHPKIHL